MSYQERQLQKLVFLLVIFLFYYSFPIIGIEIVFRPVLISRAYVTTDDAISFSLLVTVSAIS